MLACGRPMTQGPFQIAREEMRQREIFFAHIAEQAAAQRRAIVRRQIVMGALALALLVAAGIFLQH